jgi:rSAM/selenodomain-associated transferase 2
LIEPGCRGDPDDRGDSGCSGRVVGPDESSGPGERTSLEIVVVDGGSDDGTPEIVRSRPGVKLIEPGARGRAVQMNAGAAASSGDVLLFLHADTRLPARWHACVTESIRGRGMAGGRFRFDVAHPDWIYRWIARGTNFRSRCLGITYGDQAIYATRETFEAVGGFPEIQVFEDARFADRLKKAGGLDWIDEAVLTSARRWERRGPVRTLLLTWLLRLLYTFFVPPRFLARFYGVVR